MSERNLERIIDKYSRIVKEKYPGFPDKVSPHMLRRTRATGWNQSGVPSETIAVILGHSDVKTTRRAYAKPSVEVLRREMSKGSITSDVQYADDDKPLWKDDEELARLCGVR